ncbi:5'-nucleotidase, lipoprotein e(P4) family [Pseudooceanicola sp. CBS1P-1]|uniref:5'-nucleotidase, lipoprotein e(P4) family n=1 Tax=Pseudooceanicola albus TaxID=2692189 RepID=A0A6L7G2J6_9RHOB|nr:MULTISPECIES: 5'-nucleotidase, lipoprotein e(P4) family [Pseudooceanicola]MBT9383802.1 5'-nucleotidase, lipoprotein e(P4) family [Pseudooceanicola endophyticus]MXN17656.1 5'-nucleotidase, lipoprotein e(P4) family [Pseudooceanicola albus]
MRLSSSRFCLTVSALAVAAATTLSLAGPVAAQDAAKVPQDDLLNATVWMETSVEYKATVTQLFKQAQTQLDKALADKSWTAVADKEPAGYEDLPVAIVSDLDETLLDNGNYEASLITRGTSYSSKEWTDYVNSQTSEAVPGALAFLKYAASKGVTIFYVSNRKSIEKDGTIANLKKLGFPMTEGVDTVLLKGDQEGWGSDKESRIAFVAQKYRVALLMGDNLGDFSDAAGGSLEDRDEFFKASQDHWGKDWIMMPNPEYGSWESAAFGGDWSKSPDERRQMKKDALKPWTPAK